VAFDSSSSNLIVGETNGAGGVFVHDLQSGETVRASVASDGSSGNSWSTNPSISAEGRFVAFESGSNNLVNGDTNNAQDIFVHDMQSGETVRVSATSDGTQANSDSYAPSISADGRLVAFYSSASNLVSGDTNGVSDIFVHDLQSGETRRVSVASDGSQGDQGSYQPSISSDGRWVAFASLASNLVSGDTNGGRDIFVHDLQSGETERVSVASDGSQADSFSNDPSISADGRYVAFGSQASNLVSGDYNEQFDIFVHDRGAQEGAVQAAFSAAPLAGLAPLMVTFTNQTTGDFTTSLWDFGDGITSTLLSPTHTYAAPGAYTITLTASGVGGTDAMACAGYVVAYDHLGSQERASLAWDGSQGDGASEYPSISANGRMLAFASTADNLVEGDTNGTWDVFVHDRQDGSTRRVSVSSAGVQGNGPSNFPSISADGRFVVFSSSASNLVMGDTNDLWDIFIHDLQSGKTERVSVATDGTQGNSDSYFQPAVSAGGRLVVFVSYADSLVSGDTNQMIDIFVHDRLNGETRRVSVASDGTQGNSASLFPPSISADGRWVAFESGSSNLVSGDTNGINDIFVHDLQSGVTRRVSLASDGTQANGRSYTPSLSADDRFVAFESEANNLVSGDTNGSDVFVHDLNSGETVRASVASNGRQGNFRSYDPSLSADGRFVAFASAATDLVGGDTNGFHDVFVHDLQTGETRRASLAVDGAQGDNHSIYPSISADGRLVAFASAASNLVYSDTNGVADVFVQDWGIQGQPVQAGFEAAPLEGFAPLAVTFTNRTTGDNDVAHVGTDVACNVSTTFNLWTFGDGGSSILPSPVYTYTAAGVYTVTLMVSGPSGTDTLVRPAYISVQPRRFFLPLVQR
jgi:Tol biopolymer transport system component